MLVKMTPACSEMGRQKVRKQKGVNFTHVFTSSFLYENVLSGFSVLIISIYIFWQNNIGAQAAHQMLMKLNKGRKKW